MEKKGKVWLVGAGPGDVGLLTVKAKYLIEHADVIVYDRLVGAGIIGLVSNEVKLIDVGKRAGNHTMPQEEINTILRDEALKGKNVVRLKGGDPFLFGRGAEELEELVEAGIDYEVVPGVTSAIAVPEYNGIPVTHRNFTSSVHIVTGHKKGTEDLTIPFDALVKTDGTLVFLMGLSSLPFIMKGLMEAGMDVNTPAAVLQQGTTSAQRKVIATIETLYDESVKAGIKTPAIIVVGKVCALSNKFEWYEKLPLFGKRIIVTRPRNRTSVLCSKLRQLGAEVIELPSIKTIPLNISEEIKLAYDNLKAYNYIVFTSPYGVKVFLENLRQLKIDIRKIGEAKIAAIGTATKAALEEGGFIVDYMPDEYNGEELGKLIGKICNDGDKIFIPRAAKGNMQLIDEIRKRKNVEIDDIAIYDTVQETPAVLEFVNDYKSPETYVMFTSASTVKNFVNITGFNDYSEVNALCIGKQTQKAAQKYNMKTSVSDEATIGSLVDLACSLAGIE